LCLLIREPVQNLLDLRFKPDRAISRGWPAHR
jgi:hypothetical protein